MRNKLLRLDRKISEYLFHSRPYEFDSDNEEKYLWIIKTFKKFGDELELNVPSNNYKYLNVLNPIRLWRETKEELEAIDALYEIFRVMQREIINENAPLNIEKLADFLNTILHDPKLSIVPILDRINELIAQEQLFVSAYKETSTNICNEKQTLQQLLYNLYTMEMNMVKQQYEQRTIETLRAVKTAMAFAPREMWKCDPEIHKLDETYTTLTQLFQGYIVNEVDLNSVSTCKENCAYYEYTEVHGCYKNQFCSQQRKCNGRVLKCEFIDSDMWICPSDPHSDRRYEYIQYENDKFYGQRNTCKKETIKVDSWWRWLFWHCSYCFCYCDDNNKYSDRYFSLKQVVSDVANNKVVTGIRFKKVNHIIHMQIQEGELMPRGNINKISLQWKPIEEFSVLDNNVKNGVDYHTLSWANRGLDLDDLSLDTNHLLTGVRFRMVGSRLNLEIRMSTFNFTTGKLIQPLDRSFWTSRDLTDRIELKLTNPDIPIRPSVVTLPDSKSEQYLNFAPSDKISDVAQNTIPFLDTQPIELDPPVPIAGAGIFHKGRPGSGGYVALRLITYDFSKHLQVDLPLTTETVLDTPSDMKSL
ncbi:hypothetical protein WN48_04521 [Eufriesea mexicana]|nr:hypothetical protein WN48_04521 [Eufriesea mexicana]